MTLARFFFLRRCGARARRAGVSDSLMSFTAPFNLSTKSGDRTVPNFDVLGQRLRTSSSAHARSPEQARWHRLDRPGREASRVLGGRDSASPARASALWRRPGVVVPRVGRRQWDSGAELHGVGATSRASASSSTPSNPERPHKDVSVLVSDGSRAGSVEEIAANAPGCAAALRFHEERADFSALNASALRVTYTRGALAIDVDEGDTGAWRECARLKHLPGLAPPDMPDDGAAQPPGASEAAGPGGPATRATFAHGAHGRARRQPRRARRRARRWATRGRRSARVVADLRPRRAARRVTSARATSPRSRRPRTTAFRPSRSRCGSRRAVSTSTTSSISWRTMSTAPRLKGPRTRSASPRTASSSSRSR